MTPEMTNREQRPEEPPEHAGRRLVQLGGLDVWPRSTPLRSLDVWARSAPIRLAGYEDDLAEPHILPSVD
ncbi:MULTISPECIES: hypothetical protein [Streptomyces]|uniref:Uncharacterized protein n=1 Tax=Streptomyces viridosporus (strain ATCC 14672 / DSM 40746 / JCM 4963 / KCTC 9882 / NRRL B-12104 / FH 1290) TaxID=566461 RepID=D6A1D3_STRV1|nr:MULTISPECIES: hypothetical protein [Streptomyces]EFE65495.1 conserved hypothetical protein [Streptomyces viridosporus ATCC 14672]PWJ02531.1 hypothetical protein DKG34_37975 [Streptomyces sp. NWU49]